MAIELRNINPIIFDHNVGIGTESPAYKLDIVSSANNYVARFQGIGAAAPGYLYSDTNNLGLVTANAVNGIFLNVISNKIILQTANAERVNITSAGYVGIGVSSPTTALYVNGGEIGSGGWVRNTTLKSTYPVLVFNSNDSKWGGIGYDYTTAMRFWVNASSDDLPASGDPKLSILNNGNVGIGTQNPSARLEVQSSRTNSTSVVALYLTDNVTGAQTNGVYKSITSASNAGNSVSEIRFLETDGTNNNTSIAFATAPTAGGLTERMRINQSGNVGIGTTAPVSRLNITDGVAPYSAGTGEMLQIKRNTSNGTDGAQTRISLSNNSNGFSIAYGGTTDRLRFIDGGSVEVLSLVNGGNVGIGTSSPMTKLHVLGFAAKIQSPGGQVDFDLQSGVGKTYGFVVNPDWAPNSFFIYDKTADTARLVLNSSGSVGIGILAPTEKLHVVGNIKVEGSLKFADGSSYPSATASSTRVMACPIDGARGVYDNDVLWMWDGRVHQPSSPIYTMGLNGAYTAGPSTYTAHSRIAVTGGAARTINYYHETNTWNYNYMMEVNSTTRTYNANATAYAILTLPCDKNFHNVFHLKTMSGNTHHSYTANIANSSGVIQKKLQSKSTFPGGWNSYNGDVGPRNIPSKTEYYHSWLSFIIPKTFLLDYAFADNTSPTGFSVKITLNLGPDGDPNMYISGLAISRNPTGFCYTSCLDIHWGANGGSDRNNNIQYHTNGWNDSHYGAFMDGSNIANVRFPIAGTDRDILVAFNEHNNHWHGTSPLFFLHDYYDGYDYPNAIFRLSHFNTGTYGAAYAGARVYQKSAGFVVPKELVAAAHRTDLNSALQLRFRVWHGNSGNHYHYRGAYTEQVNRIGNDKTFANNAMNMKNNNFKASEIVNLSTNDSV